MLPKDFYRPLKELAEENPKYILLLERLEIDYDLGAPLSLADICFIQGMDPESLFLKLNRIAREAGVVEEGRLAKFDVPELIGYIFFTHHEYLEKELPRLEALLHDAAVADGDAYPVLMELIPILGRFRESLLWHMKEEEKVLFPFFLFLSRPENAGTLGTGEQEDLRGLFERENGEVRSALEKLRLHTRDYHVPRGAGEKTQEFMDSLRHLEFELDRHVRVENAILLPKVLATQARKPAGSEPAFHFKE